MNLTDITHLQLEIRLKQVITKNLIIIEEDSESHSGKIPCELFCVTGKIKSLVCLIIIKWLYRVYFENICYV